MVARSGVEPGWGARSGWGGESGVTEVLETRRGRRAEEQRPEPLAELRGECTEATGQDTEAGEKSLKRSLGRCCVKQTLKTDQSVWLGAVTSTEEPWGSSGTVMMNPSGLPCLSVHSSQKPHLEPGREWERNSSHELP